MRNKIKKFLLVSWPILFILGVWLIFASPYFLKSKAPYASTYQMNNFAPWSAYEKFWGPVKNGAMPDVITQIYPWKHLAVEAWKSKQIPLWNPYSFAGTPLLANYQSGAFSPFNLLFFILPFVDAWSIFVLLQPLLAGIFMYFLARTLYRSKFASIISSISFMFCGFLTTWMGYATLGYAILFLPLAIFGIEKYYQTNKTGFLLLFSLTIPLSFFSGHFQISLYFLLFVFAYILYKFISTKNVRSSLYLGIFTLCGILLSLPQLLPSIEFYSQSFRSAIFQKGEAIPWAYIPTLLAPDFFGNPVTRNDWYGHYAEWNAYIGILPLFLALYGISSKKKTQVIFLFISGTLTLLLAFNSPLLDILINLRIPVLSTSSASRIVSLYAFAFALLAAFGFDQLFSDISNKKFRKILAWMMSFAGIFVLLWMIIIFRQFIPQDKIFIARSNLILPSLIFIAVIGIITVSIAKKKLVNVAALLLIIVVSFDMLRFAKKWQPFDPKDLVFLNTPTNIAFSKIAGYERVVGNFGAEDAVYYHLPSLEGYDALYIKRYGEFISSVQNGKITDLGRSVVVFSKSGTYTSKIINILNVKYIAHKLADDNMGWTFPFWTYPRGQFKLIYKDDKYEFYENTKVLPHAFLVGAYKVAKNPQAIVDIIYSNNFNPKQEVVLESDPNVPLSFNNFDNLSEAKILDYKLNTVSISTSSKSTSILFLSDPFYPGWRALVDGVNTPIYRANYAFRAITLPKGKHNVEFTYDPLSFRLGVYGAVIGLLTIIVLQGLLMKKKD
ncbi:MAG: YfhO family protein [Candidatus Levybacteria bacterium]|nr:YfhO family protein [Candidatus Levybacteria bacterium]